MDYVVFDLETQNLLEEVGGRSGIGALRMSCAVTWDSRSEDFSLFWEADIPALLAKLGSASRVVGYNLKGFDYEVLRPYAPGQRLPFLPTLDIMEELSRSLGFRLRLDAVAQATLGEAKLASGLEAVQWWRSGQLESLAAYCRADVDITRRIYEYGCVHGHVEYFSRLGSRQKVPVRWKC